ncbi:hypothetical protein N9045_00235 [bacterium]|nr:hypothetical protein [bacterium]
MENNDLIPDHDGESDEGNNDDHQYDPNEPVDSIDIDGAAHDQEIFEETFQSLMHPFGKACEEHGIQCAIAIATHPDHDEPFVFYRASHIVEAATLMAGVLKGVKSQILEDLDTNSD